MYAYVDESGDSGFKLDRGSSEYFVIATVIVADPIPLSEAMDAFRDSLHMPKREEFKFSKTSPRRKQQFFEMVRRHDVSIRGFAVNKRLLLERPERTGRGPFYASLLERALMQCREDLIEATLVLDEFMSNRTNQFALTSALRQALQEEVSTFEGQPIRRIKDIRHRESNADNLLQVADMAAGAIYASRERQDDTYVDLIRSRIHDICDWHGDD